MCWGCGKCVGVSESMGWSGNGGRCVEVCLGCGEMCLGCGERCGKGVGVGGGRKCGKKYGTIWESGKMWGEG